MDAPCDKLDQLHGGDVLLPPQILLNLGTKAGYEVVKVHDNVDADVQEHKECGMASTNKLEEEPNNDRHHGMVDNMEGGHLVVLVSHHHEEGVHEVSKLGEKVPPDCSCHELPIIRVGVVHRLTHPVVLPTQPELAQSREDPEAEESLEEVVKEHQFLDIIGRSSFHEGRSSKSDHVVIKETKNNSWPGRRHQHPIINSVIIHKRLISFNK